MDKLGINQRLRPIRFGFVVRPTDNINLQRIFEVNTCLWGGKFNPIIPYFRKVPEWWDRSSYRFDNAKQIINGYLDFFEPDILVEGERGIASALGFDTDRVVQLDTMLRRAEVSAEHGRGLNVVDLYQQMYKEAFQFSRRHAAGIFAAHSPDARLSGLAACLFGKFPDDPTLSYVSKWFNYAFDPAMVDLDGPSLSNLYRNGGASALQLGHSKIDVQYNSFSEPTLYVLDGTKTQDLIDFWNYRTIHRELLAIPIQWLPELSEFCRSFILTNYRPLPGNSHGVMITPKVMFSRSISEGTLNEIHRDYIAVDIAGANLVQSWYPPFWRSPSDVAQRQTRSTLTAASKTTTVSVELDRPNIRFESLAPEFAERFGGSNPRWANVIQLVDDSYRDQIATTFPSEFKNPVSPRPRMGAHKVIPTTEGLVALGSFKGLDHFWSVSDGTAAIQSWLEGHGMRSQTSESGRVTQQLIQTLGGFGGVSSIASKGIVKLLDEMARRSATKSFHFMRFKERVNAVQDSDWPLHTFETLIDRKAVELGMELKCTKCGSWGWHALSALGDAMTCDLCLRQFSFPSATPNDSKALHWAYRVIGPFALPEYARGGYAAALALRFFSKVIGSLSRASVTWSAGLELTLPSGQRLEADFTLWFQRQLSLGLNGSVDVVFGEAKSFGRSAFGADDFDRMKELASSFPGSVLVFATMKEANELSDAERAGLTRLASWGREYDKERRQSRAPVIVLTGTELFSPFYLEGSWKKKGGLHEKLVEPAYVRVSNLRTLADLTQQVNLGMEPYHSWVERKWRLRAERKSSRQP